MILIVKNVVLEGPGLIGEYFKKKGYKLNTIELELGESVPEATENFQAVIVLGGPMNVYEEEKYPFLKDEICFIEKVVEKNIPFLGLCLGAQLLSKSQGAKVKKAIQEEIGFFKVKLTGEGKKDPLFCGIKDELDVFQWHGDTFMIPKNGKLLAEAETCRNQALKIGEKAYGLQFHLEIDEDALQAWNEEYLGSGDEKTKVKGLERVEKYREIQSSLKQNLTTICRNFENMFDII